jgi:hypothetical protein
VKARQEAGGRRQEEEQYSIKTGFGIILYTGAEITIRFHHLGHDFQIFYKTS